MAKQMEIYYCEKCGQVIEVLTGGAGSLVCCNEPMQLQEAGVTDAATEKHVPVIEKTADSVTVKVGEVAHPMEEDHYITMVELVVDGRVCRQDLRPGDKPEVTFPVTGTEITAREFCNKHGLWKADA